MHRPWVPLAIACATLLAWPSPSRSSTFGAAATFHRGFVAWIEINVGASSDHSREPIILRARQRQLAPLIARHGKALEGMVGHFFRGRHPLRRFLPLIDQQKFEQAGAIQRFFSSPKRTSALHVSFGDRRVLLALYLKKKQPYRLKQAIPIQLLVSQLASPRRAKLLRDGARPLAFAAFRRAFESDHTSLEPYNIERFTRLVLANRQHLPRLLRETQKAARFTYYSALLWRAVLARARVPKLLRDNLAAFPNKLLLIALVPDADWQSWPELRALLGK